MKTKASFFLVLFQCIAFWSLRAENGFAISSDGVRLYYERSGKGDPLVLIAGGPGDSHAYFKPYFSRLEKSFSIVYFDARGRGRSSKPAQADSYTVDKDADDLECLRKYLGYETFNIFGHSYGGIVAQVYALRYPEHVKHLILCNTFSGARGWQVNIDNCNRHIQESYPDVWTKLTRMRSEMKSSAKGWRKLYDPCIENLYWNNVEHKKKYLKKYNAIRTAEDDFSDDVYYAIIGDDPDTEVGGTMKDLDLKHDLNKIKAPTLILSGRADRIATVQQATEIQELIPKALLHIFNESGHYPFVEESTLFTKTVEKFLGAAKTKKRTQDNTEGTL